MPCVKTRLLIKTRLTKIDNRKLDMRVFFEIHMMTKDEERERDRDLISI